MAKDKNKPMDSVAFVKEKAEEGRNWPVIRQIQINRAFYQGFQWINWNKSQRRVFVPDLRPGEKRYTYNKIKPAILTLQAKLCKNRVKLDVAPDTDDDDRIETARGAKKMLDYQWNENSMDKLSRRLRFLMLVDGSPAIKVYVDKSKGDDLNIDGKELKGIDADMDELLEKKKVPTKAGKICTVVKDQLSIMVDPSAEDYDDIRWALEETPMDVDEIFEQWGKEVQPDDNIGMRQTFENFMTTDTSISRYKNMAMLQDYWELPCPKYPKGRRIVCAGGVELEKSEDPGEFPFIFFPAIPVPGRAVADGVVTDLTTPQKSYNIKRTAEARILEEMGNPMWLIPLQSVEDEDEISNGIGEFIHYTPVSGAEPKRVQGATVDQGWQNAMERDEADMEDISGAHEISQGSQPKGNNTLGGLQLQVEQDETRLSLLVQSYEDGMKKWGEKVLRLVQKHFPEEQLLNIVGDNGEIEAFTFSGEDLTGGEVIDVIPGSSMPTLKAVEDQKVMAMWGAGMFVDPLTGRPDTRKVVRMLGETVAENYFDNTRQDENNARLENRIWQKAFEDEQTATAMQQYVQQVKVYQVGAQIAQQQGAQPEQMGFNMPQPPVKLPIVRDFFDHQTHIDMHNRYRKTEDYASLPPDFQALIDQHVKEHMDYLMAPQKAQEAQMMQQQQVQAAQQQTQQEQTQAANDQKMQLESTKTQAQLVQTAAQMQHAKEMKAMDQNHDMTKTLVQGEMAMNKNKAVSK